MKTTKTRFNIPTQLLHLCLGVAVAVPLTHSHAADTWVTVDQDEFSGNPYDLIVDSSPDSLYQGNLYAFGNAGLVVATARRSTDGGLTWGPSDSFEDPSGPYTYYNCGVVARNGTVYSAGRGTSGVWFVRKSSDGGASWSTANTYLPPNLGTGRNFPDGMAVDPTDDSIYLVGTVSVSSRRSSQDRWLVRRSQDGGATWSNVDDYGHISYAWALDVAVSQGAVYVVGSGYDGGKSWLVRKGTPNAAGGLDWQTIDTYREEADLWAEATAITADAAGNLYAAGYAETWEIIPGTGTGKKGKPQQVRRRNWVVRTLPAGGTVWQTIDFHREAVALGHSHEARDIGVTPDGTVWVTGYALGPNSGDNLWITRKLAPASSIWTSSEVLAEDGAGQCLVTTPAGDVFTGGNLGTGNLWTIRALAGENQ